MGKRRILLTRNQRDNVALMARLEAIHTVPLLCPCIETKGRDLPLADLPGKGGWLFFTSGKGVRYFMEGRGAASCMESSLIAVVGPSTRRVVEEYGYRVDFMPSRFEAAVMMAEFVRLYPHVDVIWHVRSLQALKKLGDACLDYGLRYVPVVVYETVHFTLGPEELELVAAADWLTATSPSIVHVLEQGIRDAGAGDNFLMKPIYCIGPTTARAALEAGFTKVFYPDTYTVAGLIALLALHLKWERSRENGIVSNSPKSAFKSIK